MSWLSSFLHPERGYEKGQEQLDKYYGQAQGFLNPYNQHGEEQYGNLMQMIQKLMNPQGLQDEWIKNYKESEAAKNLESRATQQGLDSASSMGLLGSTPALQAIQAGTAEIGAADRQNYLNDLMEKYKTAAGLSQGIYGTGANAAGAQAGNAMNMGTNSANMAYGRENSGGNMLEGLLGMGGSILGGALSGGWSPFGGKK
jgi:hypothetical protein